MSIVKAYGCDCCGMIKDETRIVGVSGASDMFDNLLSYPIDMKHPERHPAHLCFDCYRDLVEIPAENETPRRKSQEEYANTVKNFSYIIRLRTINNYRTKKYFGK